MKEQENSNSLKDLRVGEDWQLNTRSIHEAMTQEQKAQCWGDRHWDVVHSKDQQTSDVVPEVVYWLENWGKWGF